MTLAGRLGLVAAAAASLILLTGCGKESVSDKAFGDKVHAYLMAHPEVLRQTAEALDRKDQRDKLEKVKAVIKSDRDKLEHDPRDLVMNPGGKITVVQFFDYNCGYCKIAGPEVIALAKSRPDVRFVFKDWPVVGGEPSVEAAKAAYGLRHTRGDAAGFYIDLIRARPANTDSIALIAQVRHLDVPALHSAADKADFAGYLRDTGKLAHDLGLEGTPAFIVGDQMFEGSDIQRLKAAIANEKI